MLYFFTANYSTIIIMKPSKFQSFQLAGIVEVFDKVLYPNEGFLAD